MNRKFFGYVCAVLGILSFLTVSVTANFSSSNVIHTIHLPIIATPPSFVTINEFMASNETTLADEDGDFSDWIELHKVGPGSIDLAGYFLTDDDSKLTKWQFPEITLLPDGYLIIFASDKERSDPNGPLHTNFKLKSAGEYLALVEPNGETIVWEYSPVYPQQLEDVSYGLDKGFSERYFAEPTPGGPNGSGPIDLGPILTDVTHSPELPQPNDDIEVTVQVSSAGLPVTAVTMHLRVMFNEETAVAMHDDGNHADGLAGDGIYGAIIPGGTAQAGEVVRWYITGHDTEGNNSRLPFFQVPDNSAEYFGTMIADPSVITELPVLYYFTPDDTLPTRGPIFYDGTLYDNVFIRTRGHTSGGLKFDMNKGDWFQFSPDEELAEEFNVNSPSTDKSYMRRFLSWDTYKQAGSPYSISFPLRMQHNGKFFTVGAYVEQVDERYLERQGLDPDGALYKMFNRLDSATEGVEKKIRQDEDHSDLEALVEGIHGLNGEEQLAFFFNNLNVPEVLNYLATTVLLHDNDTASKNYYLYRDTNNTGEWYMLPWDKDLTFGRNYSSESSFNNDIITADRDPYSHPLVGDQHHLTIGNDWNYLINALYAHPVTRVMYLRRLRSLMDEILQAPDTPAQQLLYEQSIIHYRELIAPDAAKDSSSWKPDWGQTQSVGQAGAIIQDDYLAPRREHLFVTHGPTNGGIIPAPQAANVVVEFIAVVPPTLGQEDAAYFTLKNHNATAVDISRWSIAGDAAYTFQPGTVLVPNQTMFVAADVAAFRAARASSGTNGGGHFVQGGFEWQPLNNQIELINQAGQLIDSITYGR